MIYEHVFNTKWWGEPVGIVRDPKFFDLRSKDQQPALAPFYWAEFSAPLKSAPPPALLQRTGFFQTDTQINFRINLKQVPLLPRLKSTEIRFASEASFSISPGEPAPFKNERYLFLPGATQSKIDMRYVSWGNELIANNPDLCLQLLYKGEVQGWFLSQRDRGEGLNLVLAMLHRKAQVSGMLLYQKALNAYAQCGEKLGWASFSVTNTAILNIYANLGARFLSPDGCWLWIRS